MTYVEKAQIVKNEIRDVLQEVYNELNHGQQKKLLRKEHIRAKFDFFGVQYNEVDATNDVAEASV